MCIGEGAAFGGMGKAPHHLGVLSQCGRVPMAFAARSRLSHSPMRSPSFLNMCLKVEHHFNATSTNGGKSQGVRLQINIITATCRWQPRFPGS